MEKTLLAFGVLIFAVSPSYACKPSTQSAQAFKKAVSVFIGEVVDITESDFHQSREKVLRERQI